MSNEKTPVKISLATLKKQVEEGMKRKELAEYYGIPETQMAKALKSAGLKIRKFHNPAFELVNEAEEAQVEEEPDITLPYLVFTEPVEVETEKEGVEADSSSETPEGFSFNPLNY